MRQEKAYEDLFTLRLPFIVDSVSYTSAVEAGLQSGDEVVAIDDLRDADYPDTATTCKSTRTTRFC